MRLSSCTLGSKAAITLFGDGEFDSFSRRERDEWLLTLADNEAKVKTCCKSVTGGILNSYDIERTVVAVTVLEGTDATHVVTASNDGEVANLKLDEVNNLAGVEVELNGVVDTNVRVGVSDGTSVMRVDLRDLVLTDPQLLDFAKLVPCLLI